MLIGLQIICLVFVFIMLYFTYLHYKRSELSGIEVVIMFIFWLGAALIVSVPSMFDLLTKSIAISRVFDLVVIGGFIFVIPLVYLSYVRTRRLEKKIEEYVRKETIEKAKSGKKAKK